MKTFLLLLSFILCLNISTSYAQTVTKGTKTTPCIPNYKFTPARTADASNEMKAKGLEAASSADNSDVSGEIPVKPVSRRVGVVMNVPGNYVVGKTASPDYNPVLKSAAKRNPRVSKSQPIDIKKTVRVGGQD